jgi:4'-phosphopantetheinyl transferase EntD
VNGEDRAPLWPSGFVGTISHTDGYCAVAVARDGAVESLGLDVERAEPLRPALFKMICTPAERAHLESLDEASAGRLGKLIFGAKECAYKCQYTRSRTFLGFQAMRIEVDETRSAFTAVFEQPAGEHFAPGDRIEGRFRYEDGLVLTGTTLRRA